MSSPSSRAAVGVAAVVALVTGLLASVGVAPGAVASGTYCDPAARDGLTTYEWSGGSGSWSDAGRWSGGVVPGLAGTSSTTDYVCLDAGGGVVTLDESINAVQVQAVDVAPGTTLRLVHGKLFVHGSKASRPSIVRGRLELVTSYLGGPGRIRVDGRMRIETDTGVSTITSDSCAAGTPMGATCPGLTAPGELVVAPGAWLDVHGAFGTQLQHGYRLTVQGELSLTGTGSFLSADRGTTIGIAAGGRFVLRNDGGVYEGFDRGSRHADLVNAGTIVKTGTSGASALDVTYRRVGDGAIVVVSGTVTLPRGAPGATVAGGRAFGTGSCEAGVMTQCNPSLTATDDELGRVVPSARVAVSVSEGTVEVDPRRDLAPPFTYSLGRRVATRVTLRYAPVLVGSRTSLTVFRAPRPRGTYTRVSTCRRGKIPRGKTICFVPPGRDRVRHSGGARIIVRSTVGGSLVAR